MFEERLTISLDDFIKYMKKKWIFIFTIILTCVVVSLLSTAILGERIVIEPSERFVELQKQKKDIEEYIENSIFMEIDPMNINEKVLYVKHISDIVSFKDYVTSADIWGEKVKEIQFKYLTELLILNENGNGDFVEIKVRHSEMEKCNQYAEFLKVQLLEYDNELDVVLGTSTVIADDNVMREQRWQNKLLNDINAELEYTAAGYVVEISALSAMIVGIIIGFLIAMTVLLVIFVMNKKLRSTNEISYYTKKNIIGKKNSLREKIAAPFVDSEEFKNNLPRNTIVINLTRNLLNIEGLAELQGIEFINDKSNIQEIMLSDRVIIAAAANETTYEDLRKVLCFLSEMEKELAGCIAC